MPTRTVRAAITKTSAANIQKAIDILASTFPTWTISKLQIVDKSDGTKELVVKVKK